MNERKRVLLLIFIMAAIALLVTGIAIKKLYRVAFEEQMIRLIETAQSQARLMESIARHDTIYGIDFPGGPEAATLSQIRDAHKNYTGFGETGGFNLAKIEGDLMVFILSHRHYDMDLPKPVPFDSELAEPMRLSLSGLSGTVVGLDYRGEMVLAAYEPVAELNMGIVAKIDLAEIRAPFVNAGIISLLSTVFIVFLGALVFLKVTNPLIRQLEESEERYKLATHAARVGIWDYNIKTGKLYIDPNVKAILGYSDEEISNDIDVWTEYVHPDDLKSVMNAFQAHIDGKTPEYLFEHRMFHKDGTIRWILVRGKATFNENGDAVRVIGTYTDITDRKQAEDKLKEANDIINRSPVVAFLWRRDEGWPVDFVSENVKDIFGYSAEDFLTGEVSYTAVIHPEDIRRVAREVANFSKEKKITEFTHKPYRIITKGGQIKWLDDRTRVITDKSGKITRYEGIVLDITDSKRAEEALRESEEKFHTFADFTYDWEYWVGTDGEFIYNSPSVEKITGYKPEECYQYKKLLKKIVHPKDSDLWQKHTEEESKIFEEHSIDFRIITKSGEERWIGHSCQPIYDSEGKLLGNRGSNRDITDQKRAEEELKKHSKELEKVNEEVRNFTYIVSHDLKTPLMNIRGYSDMVKSSVDEFRSIVTPLMESLDEEDKDKASKLMDERIGKSLNTISNSVIRMGNMLSSIMTLSRLGRKELDFEKVGISEIANSAIMSFAYEIQEQKIKISVGELPEILADRNSMEIVFRNLLTNAVNYLDPERKGEIEVGCDEGKNETIFYVCDNGVGIREKDIEKIFQIFQRAGKQNVPGEGMGLAYVKTVVERHDGRIWCESEPGMGSKFYFTISNDLEIK